jgi:hypothetical protein
LQQVHQQPTDTLIQRLIFQNHKQINKICPFQAPYWQKHIAQFFPINIKGLRFPFIGNSPAMLPKKGKTQKNMKKQKKLGKMRDIFWNLSYNK